MTFTEYSNLEAPQLRDYSIFALLVRCQPVEATASRHRPEYYFTVSGADEMVSLSEGDLAVEPEGKGSFG